MKWALIIFFVSIQGRAVTYVPMQDESTCMRAAERIRLIQKDISDQIGLNCVQVAQ